MDLLKIFGEYANKDQAVEKAAFEAAMVERLKTDPLKMSDLLFSLYKCQRDLEMMGAAISTLAIEIAALQPKREKVNSKKKKSHAKKST